MYRNHLLENMHLEEMLEIKVLFYFNKNVNGIQSTPSIVYMTILPVLSK